MKIEKCTKKTFVVIGKEGSTLDGQGFIQQLWADANAHFSEVQPFAKTDQNGHLVEFQQYEKETIYQRHDYPLKELVFEILTF